MSDATWRWYRRTIDDVIDGAKIDDLIELDQLQNECNRARRIINLRFADAFDRVWRWDLPAYPTKEVHPWLNIPAR